MEINLSTKNKIPMTNRIIIDGEYIIKYDLRTINDQVIFWIDHYTCYKIFKSEDKYKTMGEILDSIRLEFLNSNPEVNISSTEFQVHYDENGAVEDALFRVNFHYTELIL